MSLEDPTTGNPNYSDGLVFGQPEEQLRRFKAGERPPLRSEPGKGEKIVLLIHGIEGNFVSTGEDFAVTGHPVIVKIRAGCTPQAVALVLEKMARELRDDPSTLFESILQPQPENALQTFIVRKGSLLDSITQ
jgi:hypothetical protein